MKQNFFSKLSVFFLENSKLSAMLCLGFLLWGSLAFYFTPKQYNPEISAPAFEILVEFPGTTSLETYRLVTQSLEDVLQEVPGVDEIFSFSHAQGLSQVIVQFHVGQDPDKSKIRIRQKIESNLDLKPFGVQTVQIKSIDPDDLAIMTIAVTSTQLDPSELRHRAIQIKDELKLLDGVSLARVVGGRKKEYQIYLEPDELKNKRTSVYDLSQTLNRTSLLKNLGKIKAEKEYIPTETEGKVKSKQDIENLVIESNEQRTLQVKDVAKVKLGFVEEDASLQYRDRKFYEPYAVMIALSKIKGSNIQSISKDLEEKIMQIRHSYLGENLDLKIIRNDGRVASEEVNTLSVNLIQAIVIVFFLLFSFLNIRAALVVAISVPMVILTVIGIGDLYGHTVNRITLFALILSLGLLVDSSTVVVENIVRHLKENTKLPRLEKIVFSVQEVAMGLVLSTVTSVLAFIPMAFVTGMMGPYMGPLPFYVSVSLVVSLIFSLTLVPFLSHWILPVVIKEKAHDRLNFLQEGLVKVLKSLFQSKRKRQVLLLSLFALVFFLTLFLPFKRYLRFRMLPKADREQVYLLIDFPSAQSFELSEEKSSQLSQYLLQNIPEITHIQSYVGQAPILDFNGLFRFYAMRKEVHQVSMRLNLIHPSQRDSSSEDLAKEIRKKTQSFFNPTLDQLSIQVIEDPPGPPVKASFFLKVKDQNEKRLLSLTQHLQSLAQQIPGLVDFDNSLPDDDYKMTFKVDVQKANRSKVSTQSIADTLEVLYQGKVIGVFHDENNLEQVHITLKFDRKLRKDLTSLKEIYVVNTLGNPIPVHDFLIQEKLPLDHSILNDNRERSHFISAELEDRSVAYAAIDFLFVLKDFEIPGFTRKKFNLMEAIYENDRGEQIKIELDGEFKMTLEVFRDLGLAMGVAILFVFFTLVAQFKSFSNALFILSTVPLAFLGVIPGFSLLFAWDRIYFSATSMIGVIALSGIVVNNAILLLEYIDQKRKEIPSLSESILEAVKIRTRPILLTSLTTILGSLTIVSDPVWSGLAWSVVFGLSLSSLLTLLIFPTLYYHFKSDSK